MVLRLHNTLTRTKEQFVPIDPENVRMYVCGPTVYDFAHIGNARPLIVFDVLFRLLREIYGTAHVTYVRNITDVDDKINARAAEEHPDRPLNEAIREVTERTTRQFHEDVAALGCLPPSVEPRATEYIDRPDAPEDMIRLIGRLVENGHAYAAEGHVLFSVPSMPDYGRLSNRSLDEMVAGARVEVAPYKRDATDFVLWKPSKPGEPAWPSPWGMGRPGWHIECSAMAGALLGPVFDIHGGGIDLVFPHHENEIAQSRCAHGTETMARYWLHNGFLQVEGEKMSKSLGNFITIRELLKTRQFGGRRWSGDVVRLAILMTHYREPLDFTLSRLEEAEFIVGRLKDVVDSRTERRIDVGLDHHLRSRLYDDLDTAGVINALNSVCKSGAANNSQVYTVYKYAKLLLGLKFKPSRIQKVAERATLLLKDLRELTPEQLHDVTHLSKHRPFFKSGRLRPEYNLFSALKSIEALSRIVLATEQLQTIESQVRTANTASPTSGSRHLLTFIDFLEREREQDSLVGNLVAARRAARNAKNFAEADRIRSELEAMGIVLKDAKDPVTGNLVTTWEVRR